MEQKSLTLRECLIGDRTFYRHVAVVVLPIIVQNTLSNVVSLLDNVMVGQVGTLPMSALPSSISCCLCSTCASGVRWPGRAFLVPSITARATWRACARPCA